MPPTQHEPSNPRHEAPRQRSRFAGRRRLPGTRASAGDSRKAGAWHTIAARFRARDIDVSRDREKAVRVALHGVLAIAIAFLTMQLVLAVAMEALSAWQGTGTSGETPRATPIAQLSSSLALAQVVSLVLTLAFVARWLDAPALSMRQLFARRIDVNDKVNGAPSKAREAGDGQRQEGTALHPGATLARQWGPARLRLVAWLKRGCVLLFMLPLGVSLQVLLSLLGSLLQILWPLPEEARVRIMEMLTATSWQSRIAVAALVVVAAPVCEELLFRRWLFVWWRSHFGPWKAALLASLLFGLVHVEPSAIAYASVAGLLFCRVLLATQSVWPSIGLHAVINATPLWVAWSLGALSVGDLRGDDGLPERGAAAMPDGPHAFAPPAADEHPPGQAIMEMLQQAMGAGPSQGLVHEASRINPDSSANVHSAANPHETIEAIATQVSELWPLYLAAFLVVGIAGGYVQSLGARRRVRASA